MNRRLPSFLALTCLLGAPSCGESTAEGESSVYAHASDAIDAAQIARAAGDYEDAAAAFAFAIQNAPNEDYQKTWALQRFETLTEGGLSAQAMECVTALMDADPPTLTATDLSALFDFCARVPDARMADFVVRMAREGLPKAEQAQFDFAHAAAAVTALQEKDQDKLAELGYVDLD